MYLIQKPRKLEGVSEKGVLFYWTYSFRLSSAAPGAKNSQQSKKQAYWVIDPVTFFSRARSAAVSTYFCQENGAFKTLLLL